MPSLGYPGFLLAGATAAAAVFLLHLLARRPPDRAPLPTARFLRAKPSEAPRLRRRPTDLLLLALRMLWLLCLGAALAQPVWVRAVPGVPEVVLLDRTTTPAAWPAAVDSARRLLLGPEGEARGALVLFDAAATVISPLRLRPALFDSLLRAPPSTVLASYTAAIRAIPEAARRLGRADSARVSMISPLRWDGWRAGIAPLRRAAWPGAIRLIPMPLPAPPTDSAAPPERGRAVVLSDAGKGTYARTALAAAGWDVAASAHDSFAADAAVYVVLRPVRASTAADLLRQARGGAAVVVAAPVPEPLAAALPVAAETPSAAEPSPSGGTLVFEGGPLLAGAVARVSLRSIYQDSAILLAAWEDGRPAVAARRVGTGCVVSVAADLEGGTLPLNSGYPLALDRLARACGNAADEESRGGRLDAGALAILASDSRPAAVALPAGGAPEGVSLAPWLLGIAALAVLLETLLVYFSRR